LLIVALATNVRNTTSDACGSRGLSSRSQDCRRMMQANDVTLELSQGLAKLSADSSFVVLEPPCPDHIVFHRPEAVAYQILQWLSRSNITDHHDGDDDILSYTVRDS
jgi:hypothetical protein